MGVGGGGGEGERDILILIDAQVLDLTSPLPVCGPQD